MEPRIRTDRHGFTLVELLVVITIIGALVAILLPAVWSAIVRAREGAIAVELSQLNQAVEQYKNDLTDYPPDFSSVTALADLADAANPVVRHFRKAFPRHQEDLQAYFTDATGALNVPDASEALVFWLSMLKNDPRLPLTGTGDAKVFFSFDQSRLTDPDGDGWMSYEPRYGNVAPYLYFERRSYDSAAYAHSGASIPETVRPYRYQPPGSSGSVNLGWANETTYQIISAGLDGEFGDTPTPPPVQNKLFPKGIADAANDIAAYTEGDYDNIANFSDGKTFEDNMP